MKINEIDFLPQKEYLGGEEQLSALSTAMEKRLVPLEGTDYDYGFYRTPKFLQIYITNRGDDKQVIAEMELKSVTFPQQDAYTVDTVTTHERFRNKGLSKKLYEIALKIIKITLVAGSIQTPGGQRNWVSLANMPGVDISGYIAMDVKGFQRSKEDVTDFIDDFFKQTPWPIGEAGGYEFYDIPLAYAKAGDKLETAVKTKFINIYGRVGVISRYINVGMYAHAT